MARRRSPLQKAAGKLISAIQKEWVESLGTDASPMCEETLSHAHDFLQAASAEAVIAMLDGRTCAEYLGQPWVRAHPAVWPALRALEERVFDGDTSRYSLF